MDFPLCQCISFKQQCADQINRITDRLCNALACSAHREPHAWHPKMHLSSWHGDSPAHYLSKWTDKSLYVCNLISMHNPSTKPHPSLQEHWSTPLDCQPGCLTKLKWREYKNKGGWKERLDHFDLRHAVGLLSLLTSVRGGMEYGGDDLNTFIHVKDSFRRVSYTNRDRPL